MVTVTELNRAANITANTIDAESVSADALEATGSITDPEGNTVTSLSDPVRVTEEASNFSESYLSITRDNTVVSNGSVILSPVGEISNIISDFEDGDINTQSANWDGWDGDITNTFYVQQTTVLSGSNTAKFESNNAFNQVNSVRDNPITDVIFSIKLQIDSDTGDSQDKVSVTFGGATYTNDFELSFFDSAAIEAQGAEVRPSWDVGKTYIVDILPDFNTGEAAVYINGVFEGTYSNVLDDSWERIEITNGTNRSGSARNVYLDDFATKDAAKSGNVLIGWGGSPTDIISWDLVTFQRTIDGETVTIDVEDSNGNVLKSDISQDTDISDIATSTDVQLRANISRNDTSNEPSLDYAARRFTR
jgi:hypothetical protein